jgi:hypothetical protein
MKEFFLPEIRRRFAMGTYDEFVGNWKEKYSGRQATKTVAFVRTWYSDNVDDWNDIPLVSAITKHFQWTEKKNLFCFQLTLCC